VTDELAAIVERWRRGATGCSGDGVLACAMLDCQSCGACCFAESSSYVPLTGRDRNRHRRSDGCARVARGYERLEPSLAGV
jgi:hypothetical protein